MADDPKLGQIVFANGSAIDVCAPGEDPLRGSSTSFLPGVNVQPDLTIESLERAMQDFRRARDAVEREWADRLRGYFGAATEIRVGRMLFEEFVALCPAWLGSDGRLHLVNRYISIEVVHDPFVPDDSRVVACMGAGGLVEGTLCVQKLLFFGSQPQHLHADGAPAIVESDTGAAPERQDDRDTQGI